MFKKEIVLSYIIQVIFSVASLISFGLSYFNPLFFDIALLLMSVAFILISFNYYTIKDERKMAIMYLSFPLLILVLKLLKVL